MSFPTNILQSVATYNRSDLKILRTYAPAITRTDKKFQNFQNLTGNLGSSVTYDTPPRFITTDGLVSVWQAATQLVQTITVDQAANTSMAFTNQDRIFNVEKPMSGEDYVTTFGKSAIAEFGTKVERNIEANFSSSVVSQLTGLRNIQSGGFRFFGDGVTAIDSYAKLAKATANFRNFGNTGDELDMYIPDIVQPDIVNSGLSQFALNRNNEAAGSWDIGNFGTPKTNVFISNNLPIHEAGSVGNATAPNNQLTLVSVNDPTGANVTQMTLSGATASDVNAIKAGDLGVFVWSVSGKPDVYFRTYVGHGPSSQPVQVKILADAAADGSGNVTISIQPALSWIAGPNQNLTTALQAGMKLKIMPTHRAGHLLYRQAFFLAMPRMPVTDPYNSSSEMDPTTGVSMQLTYGSVFGQNQYGFIRQAVWGSYLDPLYSMRLLFPVSQGAGII